MALGQAAPCGELVLAQARLMLPPVCHLERHFANAMTDGGVMLMRHGKSIVLISISGAQTLTIEI